MSNNNKPALSRRTNQGNAHFPVGNDKQKEELSKKVTFAKVIMQQFVSGEKHHHPF